MRVEKVGYGWRVMCGGIPIGPHWAYHHLALAYLNQLLRRD